MAGLMVGFQLNHGVRFFILVIGLMVVGQFACSEKPTVADFVSTTISGKVQDKTNNNLIEGATVSTQPVTTTQTPKTTLLADARTNWRTDRDVMWLLLG